MLSPQQILERKPTLLCIVVASVVGILAAPIIIPHVFHGYHLVLIGFHIGGLILVAFLSVLSIAAFLRLKTKKLFFTSIAFVLFVAAETVLVISTAWPLIFDFKGISLLEIGHVLTLFTLGMLALGIFRND